MCVRRQRLYYNNNNNNNNTYIRVYIYTYYIRLCESPPVTVSRCDHVITCYDYCCSIMIIRGAAPYSCYYRYYARDDTAADETISTVYDQTALLRTALAATDAPLGGETYSPPDRNLSNSRTTFGVTFVQVPRASAHTCTCNTTVVVCGRTRREPDAAGRT